MATITGFTAERMLEIENGTVVAGSVNENGELVLTRHDGTSFIAGNVKGPPGANSNAGKTHIQAIASDTWLITHAFPYQPSVTIVDTGGSVVEGDVVYTSSQTITVSFAAAFSGSAYLS